MNSEIRVITEKPRKRGLFYWTYRLISLGIAGVFFINTFTGRFNFVFEQFLFPIDPFWMSLVFYTIASSAAFNWFGIVDDMFHIGELQ